MNAPADEARVVPQLRWPSVARIELPGSKSDANRLLVAAALSGQRVAVEGVSTSDDVGHLLAGLGTLGFECTFDRTFAAAGGRALLGPRRPDAPRAGELFCGNAGTALRFLVSVAAITPGDWLLTGDAAMRRRPIGALAAAWRQLGVDVEDSGGCPPVRVRCAALPRGGRVRLDVRASSQFLSSLMLVAPALPDGLDIEYDGDLASAEYAQLTAACLRRFGVRAIVGDARATVRGRHDPAVTRVRVARDWSSAGVWTCLEHLTGSRIDLPDLDADAGQPDAGLGAQLLGMPRRGDIEIDVRMTPDQFLDVAIVAAARDGTTRLIGGKNLRHKECDRIHVMARELRRLGVEVEELPDGLVIRGADTLSPAVIDPAGDHRVAMAFSLAGLLSPGIRIADPGCVTKSYPDFWADLERVVAERRCVAIVGMRGAGKSTFARAFAAHTDSTLVDLDERFVATYGPIGAFVAANGWSEFRDREAELITTNLRPGTVVSTGGGAIERAETRRRLREHATVVWLEAPAELLVARLTQDAGRRPSLTGAPIADEVAEVLMRRAPLFAAAADLRVDAALPTAQQVVEVAAALGASCRWPGVR